MRGEQPMLRRVFSVRRGFKKPRNPSPDRRPLVPASIGGPGVTPLRRQRIALLIVGSDLWIMMILLGSIVLETFMVYPNIFYNPPDSLRPRSEFMKVRTPHDFYPPLRFFSWLHSA